MDDPIASPPDFAELTRELCCFDRIAVVEALGGLMIVPECVTAAVRLGSVQDLAAVLASAQGAAA